MIRAGVCAVALALPGVAAAQDLMFDATTLAQCVAAAGDGAECIGMAAESCMGRTMGGYSTYGMNACTDAEAQWWDTRLNTSYQALMAREQAADGASAEAEPDRPSGAAALRDMQRAWITFRDASCDYAALEWYGGTGASTIYLGCLLDLTARQALVLERALRPM